LAGTQEDANNSPQAATNTEAQEVAAISSQQISVSQNMQTQQSDGLNGLPQHILDQLTTIIQQAQTPLAWPLLT